MNIWNQNMHILTSLVYVGMLSLLFHFMHLQLKVAVIQHGLARDVQTKPCPKSVDKIITECQSHA